MLIADGANVTGACTFQNARLCFEQSGSSSNKLIEIVAKIRKDNLKTREESEIKLDANS